MITTKQVRQIMLAHGKGNDHFGIYTNKTNGDSSQNRRVKCYYNHKDTALILALTKAAGAENVTITKGAAHESAVGPGIVVKCVLG